MYQVQTSRCSSTQWSGQWRPLLLVRYSDCEVQKLQNLKKHFAQYLMHFKTSTEISWTKLCKKIILSFFIYRVTDPPKWYKFDDGEVTECKMDDDEEMKNQCFGGEYMGEVFDHMLKR